jgi:hypothetical protein
VRLPAAPFIRTTLTVFAGGLMLATTALVRAVRIAPVDVAPAAADTSLAHSVGVPPVPGVDIDAVGNNDIFQPDRSAMPARYRMPGDRADDSGPRVEPEKPTVLGTVIASEGVSYATCQMPGGRPTIVHVGETIGGYTALSIERNKVVFKAPSGGRVEIAPL